MLMRLSDDLRQSVIYPELAGTRVLITGVSAQFGVDISRAFADHSARIVLQVSEPSQEMDEVTTMLAETTPDLKVFNDAFQCADDAVKFAKDTAQRAFGGLEVVINLITLTPDDLSSATELDEVEALITDKLLAPTVMSRILANRMRLTWNDGLVLNVINAPAPRNARESALISMIRATLATITRTEASDWADQGVRINAVGPSCVAETPGARPLDMFAAVPWGEPQIATLALNLASARGTELSGQVFDTDQVSVSAH